MIYSIHEIQQRIAPVVKQYGVKAVWCESGIPLWLLRKRRSS